MDRLTPPTGDWDGPWFAIGGGWQRGAEVQAGVAVNGLVVGDAWAHIGIRRDRAWDFDDDEDGQWYVGLPVLTLNQALLVRAHLDLVIADLLRRAKEAT